MPDRDAYTAEDFPHGLRCAECHREFVEGQPISQQFDGMIADTPMVVLVCVPCGLETPVVDGTVQYVCCEKCESTNLELDGWDIDKCRDCGHWRCR